MEEKRELNEMERLERNIIKSYNRLLKTLLEEGGHGHLREGDHRRGVLQ